MSRKSARIQQLLAGIPAGAYPVNYLGYFACFNQGLFYEAHDVLEEIWLPDRQGPKGDFFKGLIQLAGAFVHLQKNRLQPSSALFKLARVNFQKYLSTPWKEGLEVKALIEICDRWVAALEGTNFTGNPLHSLPPPRLEIKAR